MSVSIETNTVISADYYGMTKKKSEAWARVWTTRSKLCHFSPHVKKFWYWDWKRSIWSIVIFTLGVFKSVEVLKILKFIHKLSPSQTKTNFVSIFYLVEQNPRTYYKTLSKALCISSKRIEIKSKKVISLALIIKILDFWGPQNWNIAKILKCPNMKGKMTIIQTL